MLSEKTADKQPVSTVDIGSHVANLDDKGNWTYIEKALKADTLYGRKEDAKYQDKAEIKVLEDVENKSKDDFRETIRNTVIEVVKYLQTLTTKK